MLSSDADLDPPLAAPKLSERQRKQQQRADALALARLHRASASASSSAQHRDSTRSRPQPHFLGADNPDHADADSGPTAVDFSQWEKQRPDRAHRHRRRPTPPTKDASPTLDHLFDLDDRSPPPPALDAAPAIDAQEDSAPTVAAKRRRPLARLDEARLLGPTGFPQLRRDLARLRFSHKKKGHHTDLLDNLQRLLATYQLWAHHMYPKTNFRDTLQAVEKLCHKRTIQRALQEYRNDEKHRRANVDAAHEHDAFADLDDGQPAPAVLPDRADLLAAAGFDQDVDVDVDADEEEAAVLAALEAEAAYASALPVTSTSTATTTTGMAGPMRFEPDLDFAGEDEDDEAEAALREAEALLM